MSLAIDTLMDIRDVAAVLGFSPSHIYRVVQRGEIGAVRSGRRVRVFAADVLEWLNRNYVPRKPQNDDELFTMLIEEKYDVSRSK